NAFMQSFFVFPPSSTTPTTAPLHHFFLPTACAPSTDSSPPPRHRTHSPPTPLPAPPPLPPATPAPPPRLSRATAQRPPRPQRRDPAIAGRAVSDDGPHPADCRRRVDRARRPRCPGRVRRRRAVEASFATSRDVVLARHGADLRHRTLRGRPYVSRRHLLRRL